MKVQDYRDVTAREELPGVTLRVVISEEDGAPNFIMRVFEVQPGASTPWHTHDWEHEVFVLAGEGQAVSAGGRTPIEPGSVVFVAPNEQHQFVNAGSDVLRFICCIPRKA
ncbi:MAG: cupin domain-containing protein [Dehalococcoidia bacterium]|nr:cupin domain-containing protein [Dehalococcoidia bacterium]